MTNYSTVDWSKCPALPLGMHAVVGNNCSTLQLFSGGAFAAALSGRWRYAEAERASLLVAFAATDIIDRFIAEQEAELANPKSRRVTPKGLLVELIQTGVPILVADHSKFHFPSPVEFRWTDCGVTWLKSETPMAISEFMKAEWFDIIDTPLATPKPRLPVKTQAPDGCRWTIWQATPESKQEVCLEYEINSDKHHVLLPTSLGLAVRMRAVADAYLELNP